jgi:DNA-binding transcriptional regulator YiaG
MAGKPNPQAFGELVRAWRERRRLSRVDASRKLGIPLRTLEDWEYGRRTPKGLARELILRRFRA